VATVAPPTMVAPPAAAAAPAGPSAENIQKPRPARTDTTSAARAASGGPSFTVCGSVGGSSPAGSASGWVRTHGGVTGT
jgi:hypothetical protein